MLKKNLFFDLDGTIINSEKGILNSVKYMADVLNINLPPYDKLKKFIGPPPHKSFKEIFGAKDDEVELYLEKYREYYLKKGMLECCLYDGIIPMLDALRDKFNLFITTSKPVPFAEKILKELGADFYFIKIAGPEKDSATHTKKDVIDEVINEYKLKKEECVLIGDTLYDGEGAKECKIDFIGVTYGFGDFDELKEYSPIAILKSPYDIISFFL